MFDSLLCLECQHHVGTIAIKGNSMMPLGQSGKILVDIQPHQDRLHALYEVSRVIKRLVALQDHLLLNRVLLHQDGLPQGAHIEKIDLNRKGLIGDNAFQ